MLASMQTTNLKLLKQSNWLWRSCTAIHLLACSCSLASCVLCILCMLSKGPCKSEKCSLCLYPLAVGHISPCFGSIQTFNHPFLHHLSKVYLHSCIFKSYHVTVTPYSETVRRWKWKFYYWIVSKQKTADSVLNTTCYTMHMHTTHILLWWLRSCCVITQVLNCHPHYL